VVEVTAQLRGLAAALPRPGAPLRHLPALVVGGSPSRIPERYAEGTLGDPSPAPAAPAPASRSEPAYAGQGVAHQVA